jgi:hypothetical protein
MGTTTFSGPVVSNNGFQSNTLVIGTTVITQGTATGSVSAQAGYIPVSIGGTTKYIALYSSLTP